MTMGALTRLHTSSYASSILLVHACLHACSSESLPHACSVNEPALPPPSTHSQCHQTPTCWVSSSQNMNRKIPASCNGHACCSCHLSSSPAVPCTSASMYPLYQASLHFASSPGVWILSGSGLWVLLLDSVQRLTKTPGNCVLLL